jgi:hypothetical protein
LGQVHELAPNPADPVDEAKNPFYAAGVSMGLLGVISTVTFQCQPRFNVIGSQETHRLSKSPLRLESPGADGLEAFLRCAPYSRLLWWPQKGVEKIQIWQASRATKADEPVTHPHGKFKRRPFKVIPEILGSNKIPQHVINAFYNTLRYDKTPFSPSQQQCVVDFLSLFLDEGEVKFWDEWYLGIPMDDPVNDHLMPTEFTELFVDLEKSAEVMKALQEFYAGDEGMVRTGAYANELYAGRKSKFWLSPNYGRDSVRVDLFWFKTRKDEPPDRAFYPQYWDLLKKFDFRFHWGKYLSDPASSTGVEFRRKQFPMWNQFMKLRNQMDPKNIFLTSYWKKHLGL